MTAFPGPLFYSDAGGAIETANRGDTVELTGSEAHHAVAVRRVRAGETISIGDGAGRVITGTARVVEKSLLTVIVQDVYEARVGVPELVLVQALAKGGRDELAIQSATEIGVDRIVPWAAQRSVVRWDERKATTGMQRWQTIAREAAKQSLRATIPFVAGLATTQQVAAEFGANSILLDLHDSIRFVDAVTAITARAAEPAQLAVIVGPEGGVSPEEHERFRSAGAMIAVLGETVLRTSTAGPVAIALAQSMLGRW